MINKSPGESAPSLSDESRDFAPPEIPAEFEDALKLFTVLARASSAMMERSRENIGRHGLTSGEFSVLEALYHKGPLLLGEIKSKILVSSGGITWLVDRLAARNLVERRDCASDRRARYAALTPEGRGLMDRIFPDHARCLTDAARGLSDEEKREAAKLLKALGKGARRGSR